MKPEALFHYRDYIASPYWTERKRQYFETHLHVCEVCGHPDVDLNHLKYGDYGREDDRDLSALCRVHHEEFHSRLKLRKNMKHLGRMVIDEMKHDWEAMRNAPLASKVDAQKAPSTSLADIVEKIASPIWKLYRSFF